MNARRLERLKTIFIALLFVLLMFMTVLNFLYDRDDLTEPLLKRISGGAAVWTPAQDTTRSAQLDIVFPVAAALRNEGKLLGTAYGGPAASLYDAFRPLLGMVLASAQNVGSVSADEWRTVLQRDGVYFRFYTGIPAWLLSDELLQETSAALDGLSFDRLLLSGSEEGKLLLYLGVRGGIMRFETPLPFDLPGAGEYAVTLSGAVFASELDLPGNVPGDTLFVEHTTGYPVLRANPVTLDDTALSALLTTLDFNPNTDLRFTDSHGEQVFVDNQRTIHITPDGGVTYRDNTAADSRATVLTEEQELQEAIRVAKRAIPQGADFWGEGRLHLQSAVKTGGGVVITLAYLHGGTYVKGGESVLVVREGLLREAQLNLLPVYDTGELTDILPQRQAALLLPRGSKLALGYALQDGVYAPLWMHVTY